MRILLCTDSLGCPREEISVADTWTDRIISKWSGNNVYFYTYCKHGLASKDININYVKEIEPDLIIMQVGIVDACRRTLSRKELRIIRRIPIFGDVIRRLCKRYHYAITKIRNVHYCSLNEFMKKITEIKKEVSADVVFISIASAGSSLVKKVYDVQNDIDRYNAIIKDMSDVDFINPYDENTDDFIITTDGHHLNLRGEEMVFQAVDKVIENFVREERNV